MQALVGEVKQYLEDIHVKLGDAANAARSNYQVRRWEVTRLTDSLVEGEHGLAVAKHISQHVVDFVHLKDNNVETFKQFYPDFVLINPTVVEMKAKDSLSLFLDSSTEVGKYIADAKVEVKVALDAKIEQLHEHLDKNPKQIGSVGHVSGARLKPNMCGIVQLLYTDKEGAEGWAIACHQNKKRANPKSLPLRGLSAIFCSINQWFVVYACSMEKALEKGVTHLDIDAWLEKPTGQEFLEESMIRVVLPPGSSLYIPNGMFWSAVHIEIDKYQEAALEEQNSDSEGDEKKSKLHLSEKSVADALVFPLFVDDWLSSMPANVRLTITQSNMTVFNENCQKSMWRNRSDFFREAFDIKDKKK